MAGILSVDVGFGSTKVTYIDKANRLTNKKFITALAKKVNSGIFMDDDSVEMDGVSYLCFDRALKVPSNQQIQVMDFESLCLATPIFIKKIQKELGLEFDHIVAGLSIAMVDKLPQYHQRIYTALGLDPNNVKVLQQGVGGWFAYSQYGLDPYQSTDKDPKMLNYLLIDIGHNTMDVISVIDGKLSEDTVDGITGAGTMWMAGQLSKYLLKEYKVDVTPANARELLESKTWSYRGFNVDLTPVLNQIGTDYAEFIINTLESKFANSMANRQGLLFIGGSSLLLSDLINNIPAVAKMFKDRYGEFFINIPKMPEYYNSAGYYLIGARTFKS